jgi:hypothetical protein
MVISLEIIQETALKNAQDLNERLASQLNFILHANIYFGSLKTIDGCFGRPTGADDGRVYVKEVRVLYDDDDDDATPRLWYWLAYFGGNPTGYLLVEAEEGWNMLVENCDGDFIYHGTGDDHEAQAGFVTAVKKCVLGDHYYELVEEEA